MGLVFALWISGKYFKALLFKLCALRGLSIHIQHNSLILRNVNDKNIQCFPLQGPRADSFKMCLCDMQIISELRTNMAQETQKETLTSHPLQLHKKNLDRVTCSRKRAITLDSNMIM